MSAPSDDPSTTGVAQRVGRPTPHPHEPVHVPALTILCHPAVGRIGERSLLSELAAAGGRTRLTRHEPSFAPSAPNHRALGVPLGDSHVSRQPLWLHALPGGALRLDARETRTVVTWGDEELRGEHTFTATDLAEGVVLVLAERIALLLHTVLVPEPGPGDDLGLVGRSAGLLAVRDEIRRVADLDVPILLRGETGTGKELVARAIHRLSRRHDRPLVSVNLGAIPPSLAAAELFGAARGAYTGAVRDQEGFFRRARDATLFLDEIGEAPTDVQVMLLRALETGEIYPVGAQRPERIELRIIAATDADLEGKAREGTFRLPLLHRLAGYEIRIPPLRERRDDIARLLLHFLREEMAQLGEAIPGDPASKDAAPWLGAGLVARLVRHDWPGNVRQLRNVARQLVIANRGRDQLVLTPQLLQILGPSTTSASASAAAPLPAPLPAPSTAPLPAPLTAPMTAESESARAEATAPSPGARALRKPSTVTEEELASALTANRWDLAGTARALGISRPSLYVLIERSGHVRTAGDLAVEEIVQCHRELGGDLDEMAMRLRVSRNALRRRLRELGLR